MTGKRLKNSLKFTGTLLLFLLTVGLAAAKPCYAASAEIDISTDSTEITVGDRIFVYVMIKADTKTSGFEANVTYDDDILEYQSKASYVTGNNGFLKITDVEGEAAKTRKYTLQFEAAEAGVCKIAIDGRAMVYDYETGDDLPVSNNVLSINVKAPVTASDDASLKSLKISPSTLTPAFDKNVFDYSASVASDVQSLIIDAITEDKKAIVTIFGNESLKEGENKIIIHVLAESGAVIEYTVNVTKEAAPADETDNEAADPTAVTNALELIQKEGTVYAVYGGKYKLLEPDSTISVPAGYVKTKIIISDISINAYYPENNIDSEYLLIYAENDKGTAGFYRYDKVEKTLQRFDSGIAAGNVDTDNQAVQEAAAQMAKYKSNLNKAALVIAILSILCIVLIVFLVRNLMHAQGKKRKK